MADGAGSPPERSECGQAMQTAGVHAPSATAPQPKRKCDMYWVLQMILTTYLNSGRSWHRNIYLYIKRKLFIYVYTHICQ